MATAEWMAMWASDPLAVQRRVVPIKLEDVESPGLLRPIAYINIVGLDEDSASSIIQAGVLALERKASSVPAVIDGRRREAGMDRLTRFPLPRNPNFAQREDLLAKMQEWRGGIDGVAVQILSGMGGVGKTQLALEYAYRQQENCQLVWWIVSDTAASIKSGLTSLASELLRTGRNSATGGDLMLSSRDWLEQNRQWLLIFDNVLTPDAIVDLLPRVGHGDIVITSQWGDWDGFSGEVKVEPFTLSRASAYLQQRTQDHNIAAAEMIAEHLGGLPLALEQAAAYIRHARMMTLQLYLHELETRGTSILAQGGVGGYSHTTATTWNMSLERAQANDTSIRLLKFCCSMAPDQIPIRDLTSPGLGTILAEYGLESLGAAASLGEAVGHLSSLSIVSINDGSLSIHRLLRRTILERMSDQEVSDYARAALAITSQLFPRDTASALQWDRCRLLVSHADYVTQEGRRYMRPADMKVCVELLRRISTFLVFSVDPHTGIDYAYRAAIVSDDLYGSRSVECVNAWSNYAALLAKDDRLDESRRILEHQLSIVASSIGTAMGDERAVAILRELSWILVDYGDPAGGLANIRRAYSLAVRRYLPSDPIIERILDCYGWILFELGDYSGAAEQLRKAVKISELRYGPNDSRLAQNLDTLGEVLIELGDLEGASDHLLRAQRIAIQIYDEKNPRLAEILWSLAKLWIESGNESLGQSYVKRTIDIVKERAPKHPDAPLFSASLGQTMMRLGEVADGLNVLHEAEEQARSMYGREHHRYMQIVKLREREMSR